MNISRISFSDTVFVSNVLLNFNKVLFMKIKGDIQNLVSTYHNTVVRKIMIILNENTKYIVPHFQICLI